MSDFERGLMVGMIVMVILLMLQPLSWPGRIWRWLRKSDREDPQRTS